MKSVIIISIIVILIIVGSSIWAINRGYSNKHRDTIDELPEENENK